jgi:hypothetical protein
VAVVVALTLSLRQVRFCGFLFSLFYQEDINWFCRLFSLGHEALEFVLFGCF